MMSKHELGPGSRVLERGHLPASAKMTVACAARTMPGGGVKEL